MQRKSPSTVTTTAPFQIAALLAAALPTRAAAPPAPIADQQGATLKEAEKAEDDISSSGLPEIVVTAQKREQSVHGVPMAIEVRSGEFIEQTGFVDFEDYARTALEKLFESRP